MEPTKKVHLKKPVDVDKIKIKKDRFFANAYTIEFELDSQPDHVWHTFFEREWKLSRHLWDRKVVILGDKLLLITTPNHVEDKVSWLKEIIDATNKRVEEYIEAEKEREERETRKVRADESVAIEKIREALRRVAPA